jgi:hypothetical protein
MEIYTKVFLINWVVLLVLMALDKYMWNDYLENHRIISWPLGIWSFVSLCSVPVWLIYTW